MLRAMRYFEKLEQRIAKVGSKLCVGIDPRPELTPEGQKLETFLQQLIEETAPFAASFKPNIAYFEAMGLEGLKLLEKVNGWIKSQDTECPIPICLDVKRSDIGATQAAYAKAYFDVMDVDSVTINPFMGYDSIEPMLDFEGKGIYLLAVTSNPGSADLERQQLSSGKFVYEVVCDFVKKSKQEGRKTDVGLVVGLTNAEQTVLDAVSDIPLLIPGLGAQGGDVQNLESRKALPDLVNVSRGVSYMNPELSFAEKADSFAKVL